MALASLGKNFRNIALSTAANALIWRKNPYSVRKLSGVSLGPAGCDAALPNTGRRSSMLLAAIGWRAFSGAASLASSQRESANWQRQLWCTNTLSNGMGAAPKLGFGGVSVKPHCAHMPDLALGGWSSRHRR